MGLTGRLSRLPSGGSSSVVALLAVTSIVFAVTFLSPVENVSSDGAIALVAAQSLSLLAPGELPEFENPLAGWTSSRYELLAIRTESARVNPSLMPSERLSLLPTSGIPESDRSVSTR